MVLASFPGADLVDGYADFGRELALGYSTEYAALTKLGYNWIGMAKWFGFSVYAVHGN
jgi:hypothetical protein